MIVISIFHVGAALRLDQFDSAERGVCPADHFAVAVEFAALVQTSWGLS